MSRNTFLVLTTLFTAALALGVGGAAVAGVHTWDVNEVFSNADGTIQFVELREAAGTANETGVGNGSLSSMNGSGRDPLARATGPIGCIVTSGETA